MGKSWRILGGSWKIVENPGKTHEEHGRIIGNTIGKSVKNLGRSWETSSRFEKKHGNIPGK